MRDTSTNSSLFVCCEEATLLVVKKEITKLSLRELIALKFHLLICKFCRLFQKQSNEINHVLQNHSSIQDQNISLEKKQELTTFINNLNNTGV